MRFWIGRCMLAAVLALVVTNGFAADAAPPAVLVKVTLRDGTVVWGELKSQRGRQVAILDLASGQDRRIGKGSIASIDRNVTDDQVAQGAGVEPLAAWKTLQIAQATLASTDVGKVVRIADGSVFIAGNQAAVDDKLQAYHTTQITDPDTKKVLGSDTTVIAELKVKEVSAGFIKAEVTSTPGRGPKLAVDDTVRTEPEMLPVVTVAADGGAAGEADKAVLADIVTRLSAADMSVADAAQTAAALQALHLSSADALNPAAAQKLGQKLGASAVIIAHAAGPAPDADVQVRIVDVASAAVALSVAAPAPAWVKNATTFTLTISMHVDGKDEVDIGSDSITVRHREAMRPTNIKINGIPAEVDKPIPNHGSTQYLSSKADLASAQLVSQSGRGQISINNDRDHVAVIFDDPEPGSADYSATLQFTAIGGGVAGAPKPAQPGTPVAGLFSLAGAAGLPQYLTCDTNLSGDQRGLSGGRAYTRDSDFIDKDFVLDVVFAFDPGEHRGLASVGIGTPDHGLAVQMRSGGDFGHNASMATGGRAESGAWATYPADGEHLLRLEKTGDVLKCSITSQFDGTYRADAMRTVASIRAAFPDASRINSPLFFDGGAIFKSIRLQVAGKTVDPGQALPAIADPADDAGWTRFVPGASLPRGFAADPNVTITEKGMDFRDGAHLFTTDSDYIDKDFTLDVVYDFAGDELNTLQVGLGNARHDEDRSLHADANGPRKDGSLQFGDYRLHSWDVGSLHQDHTGPNLLRLQKRGDTLTMAVCVDYKDKFTPDFVKVIPSIKAVAPMIDRLNSFCYFGGGGTVERARLIVDGQPSTKIAAIKPDDAPVANLIRLRGPALPTFLEPQRDLRFDSHGVSVEGKAIRTSRSDLADRDFSADLLIRPPTGGGGMMRIGYGAEDRSANANWVDQSVYLDFTGNSSIELATTHEPETIGHFNDPGPHLVRVRKAGNTLTFSICLDYRGKFEPDIVRTIPDLKAVLPTVDSQHSFLFIQDGGTIVSMAMSIGGQAVDSRDVALAVPADAVEGKPIDVQIASGAGSARFAVDDGAPAGLRISPDGRLTWTPTHDQVGAHSFQVRITRNGSTINEDVNITVVSAADASSVHGDLAQLDRLYNLPLTQEKHFLGPGADSTLLLLEGDTLRRLGSDGFTVKETHHFSKKYDWIGERPDYFVALSSDKKCLDLIDKDTLVVRKSLQMQYFALHDLCLVPHSDICYVMVEKSTSDGLEPQILIVNERTGDVREPDDFGGTFGKVSPDGKSLYVGYKDIYEKGERLLFNPDHIDVIPDYGNIDILVVYDITHPTAPVVVSAKNDAGGNGFGIAVSADGTKVSYLSFVGYPLYSKNIGAWDPSDLTKRPVSYPTKDNKGDCKYLAFHPMLPIAATAAETGAICFDQNTGELQPNRLDFGPALGEVKVTGLIFSPDGKNLILDCSNPTGTKFFLRRVKVYLSADELKQLQHPPIAPAAPRPHGEDVPKA